MPSVRTAELERLSLPGCESFLPPASPPGHGRAVNACVQRAADTVPGLNEKAVTLHLCSHTGVSFSVGKQETGSRRGQDERRLLRLPSPNRGRSSKATVSQLGRDLLEEIGLTAAHGSAQASMHRPGLSSAQSASFRSSTQS